MAKIIVVEDEGIEGMGARFFLEQLGHEVQAVVEDSRSFFAECERSRPDVVLMDIVLKGKLNGIEITRMVNRQYGFPVIYMTALNDQDTLQAIEKTEHCGVLIKPFETNELKEVLGNCLPKQ